MLDLAINNKDYLNKEYRNFIESDHSKFYFGANWVEFEIKIDDTNYYKIQYVSVDSNKNVIGYFEAEINRDSNNITNITVVKFKNTIISSLDLFKFLEKIYKMPILKIEWWCISGNNAEKLYDKIIKKYGGSKIGVYKNSVKLRDGKYYDRIFYEIII